MAAAAVGYKNDRAKVIVVGCGIVGLSTAVCLQETAPNVEVTIVADTFDMDTTSYGAAGLLIVKTFTECGAPDRETGKKWFQDSFNFCNSLFLSEEAGKVGVQRISGYILGTSSDDIFTPHAVKEASKEGFELDDDGVKLLTSDRKFRKGNLLTTYVMDGSYMLNYLTNKFKKNGGRVETRTVNDFSEFVGQCDVVVNCTGLGSKKLLNDDLLNPIRGQVYKLKAPWIKHFYYHAGVTYIIPGVDYVTVGGTRDYGHYNTDINVFDSMKILNRAEKILPSLKHAEVVRQWSGLRPHRKPVRVEKDMLTYAGRKLRVVHNYGHGSYGVTLSWGTARHATRLILEYLQDLGFSKVDNTKIASKL